MFLQSPLNGKIFPLINCQLICYLFIEHQIGAKENLGQLLEMISSASEFSDIQLRVNERKSLNQLNKDKSKVTIRFPMQGRITSRQMKINWQ